MSDGHGHVVPRADGAKAKCGGPLLCGVCAREFAETYLDNARPDCNEGASRKALAYNSEQTAPSTGEEVWPLVIRDVGAFRLRTDPAIVDALEADMRERCEAGRRLHGKPLRVGDGRDALLDAYAEALDLVGYLRQEMETPGGMRVDQMYWAAMKVTAGLREIITARPAR